MTELYAYDFDGTLIQYDSLNRFLRLLVRKLPIQIGWILLLRVLRIMSAIEMKKRVNRLVMRDESLLVFAQDFARRVVNEVKWGRKCPSSALCVIISASPICYMQYVGALLGVELVASGENVCGSFVNMYGEEKLLYLEAKYPTSEYIWRYAASDSTSDLCWMEKFDEYEIIK